MKRFIDALIYPLVLLLAALGLVAIGAGATLGLALDEGYIIKKPDKSQDEDEE